MKITAHNDAGAFDALKPEWNPLLKRAATDLLFNTWGWHKYWWDNYHPGDLWMLTIRDSDDILRGIAPFFILGKSLHFVGCEDVTDYLDIIVDKDHTDAVYATLAAFLNEQDVFQEIDLCNIPEFSPTCQQLPAALERCQFEVSVTQQEVCPVIDLPDDFDAYLEALDSKQRRDVRRKLRKADAGKQRGIIDWYIVDESHDLQAEIDRFLNLMRIADPEKEKFLSDENNVRFFNAIIPAMLEQGWLQLNFMTVNGEAAAAYLNFDYENRIYVYNSGLDAAQFGKLSPGIILLAYNIQYAIEQGRDKFDFLRGDENYKYRMGGQNTTVYNLKA
ncbi:MAG: GNAT family N-acetyltransferase [Aggregatilineales bacterium]